MKTSETTNVPLLADQLSPLDMVTVPLEGSNLIEASAGTGKTFTIAHLYLRFILEAALSVNEILVVTFTEKATKELKERLRLNLETALETLQKWSVLEDHGELLEADGESLEADGESLEADGESLEADGESLEIDGDSLGDDGMPLDLDVTQKNRVSKDNNPKALSPLESILDHYLHAHQDDFHHAMAVGIKRLRLAVVSFDEAAIFTIHGFCQRMLNENAFESGLPFDLELITDDGELLTEIVNDFWRLRIQTADDALAHHLIAAKFNRESLMELAALLNGKEQVTIDCKAPFGDTVPDLNVFTGIDKEAPGNPSETTPPLSPSPSIERAPDTLSIDREMETLNEIQNEIAKWQATITSDSFKDEISSLLLNAGIFNLPYKAADKIHEAFSKLSDELNELGKAVKTVPFPFSISHLENKRAKKYQNDPIPRHDLFTFVEGLPKLKQRYIQGGIRLIILIKIEFIQYFLSTWSERKTSRSVQTFNDILLNLRRALRQDREHDGRFHALIRSKIKAAMIDEFQDTDPVQFEIFDRLFMEKEKEASDIPLFLIGDPKQSIYKFRGADIYAYLQAKQRVTRRWTLNTNYRAQSGIVDALNYLFIQDFHGTKAHHNPFAEPDIPYLKVDVGGVTDKKAALVDNQGNQAPSLSLLYLDNDGKLMNKSDGERAVCDVICREIFHLVHAGSEKKLGFEKRVDPNERLDLNEKLDPNESEGTSENDASTQQSINTQTERFTPLKPSDIAVLVRSRNEASTLQVYLADLGIPSVIQATGDVFKSDEADAMLTLLLAVALPGEFTLRPFLLTPFIGKQIEEMEGISENEIQEYYQMILELSRIWERQGFMSMFRTLMRLKRGYSRILSQSGGERIITNMLHLAELIHQYALERRKGIEGTLTWFRERLQEPQEIPEHEIHLERDADALQIITVHSSKGLEFNVVFCPFEWRRSFTGYRSNNKALDTLLYYHREGRFRELDLHQGGPDWERHLTFSYHETLAENIRLLYVALTRARNRCYLVTGDISDVIQSALNHLIQNSNANTSNENGERDEKRIGLPSADYFTRMAASGTGSKTLKRSEAELMRATLTDLVERSKNRIAMQVISSRKLKEEPLKERLSAIMEPGLTLQAKVLTTRIEKSWGIASFSWLTRNIGHGHKQAEPAIEDPNVSEDTGADPITSLDSKMLSPDMSNSHGAKESSLEKRQAPLPKGARTGLAIHEIFEKIDFNEFETMGEIHPVDSMGAPSSRGASSWKNRSSPLSQETEQCIETTLKKFGIIPPDSEIIREERLQETQDLVASVLTTPISLDMHDMVPMNDKQPDVYLADSTVAKQKENTLQFCLAQVPLSKRLNELEFFYPIQHITPEDLFDLFSKHGVGHVGSSFAQRMETLTFNLRKGFMQGFVDLIFENHGKYYLLDWKTNWLGDSKAAYTSGAIIENMIDACYILQYHIYTLAVHRWLSSKLPDYRYDTHFGGVIYAYVRGMDPSCPDSGIYFDRPSASLIDALGTMLGGALT